MKSTRCLFLLALAAACGGQDATTEHAAPSSGPTTVEAPQPSMMHMQQLPAAVMSTSPSRPGACIVNIEYTLFTDYTGVEVGTFARDFTVACCNSDKDCVGSPSGAFCVAEIDPALDQLMVKAPGYTGLCQPCDIWRDTSGCGADEMCTHEPALSCILPDSMLADFVDTYGEYPDGCPIARHNLCTLANSCIDGLQNDKETDIDCGGGHGPFEKPCPPCTGGKHCTENSDCRSHNCDNGVCVNPPPPPG